MTSLFDKTPNYTPKKSKIPQCFASSISLKYDPNYHEVTKKLRIATDISKFRNSSEYAGKRIAHVEHVESLYLERK